MYFKFSLRKHPQSEKLSAYYRLVESYRNAGNRVCQRTILNVGFMEDVTCFASGTACPVKTGLALHVRDAEKSAQAFHPLKRSFK
ncbi:hypothetical protein P872_13090 [Rhodonellum psychrophilum GCM71 = DSM 17998]|uniref:Uncharacterized protein n=1 Tax=Rhodonellum psychrophilum GCM71 = DSM 17998 TaxID=1123057 RepID=U5BVC9_9BACT|nr:hypothetical protein P872_13090 [Rhodonellum psychrophilum GCM71 = DSM 17998]